MAYVPPHLRNRPAGGAGGPSTPPDFKQSNGATNGSYSSPSRSTPHSRSPWSTTSSQPRRDAPNTPNRRAMAPSLHVFGDSFAGPFKLLDDTSARTKSFKGASAKGLNNPKSIKQVSNELVPLLNSLLAPPPYAYLPPTGRFALLMFGNVDLQINYLWQLMNKPMGPGTWKEVGDAEEETKVNFGDREILANATESMGGIALGPERFVDNVTKAYCAWLEREIVNGPIGRRAAEVAKSKSDPANALAPTKLLIAAALPPLVEDETLPRIPEKYVERLVEDHHKAAKLVETRQERASRTPWAKKPENGTSDVSKIEVGMSTLKTTDASPPPATPTQMADMDALFAHNPPLVTKPVRVRMTDRYNAIMKAFCEKHPQVLGFVDIGDVMLAMDAKEGAKPAFEREVSRATWACPVDPSNIHPLWEPTIPLWLEKLKAFGIPTDQFAFSTDAEDTFKAYEEDKKLRTARREGEWKAEAEEKARIKLREE